MRGWAAQGIGVPECLSVPVFLVPAQMATWRKRQRAAGPPTGSQNPSSAWHQACLLQDKAGGKGKRRRKGWKGWKRSLLSRAPSPSFRDGLVATCSTVGVTALWPNRVEESGMDAPGSAARRQRRTRQQQWPALARGQERVFHSWALHRGVLASTRASLGSGTRQAGSWGPACSRRQRVRVPGQGGLPAWPETLSLGVS